MMISKKLFMLSLLCVGYLFLSTSYAIPANSHVFGGGWQCNIGYKKQGQQCNKIFVPPNAVFKGTGWICQVGFKRVKNQCNKLASKNNTKDANSSQAISEKEKALMTAYVKAAYSKNGDDKAAEFFKPMLKAKNATAQYFMGMMYSKGVGGLTKDDKAAVALWEKSAEQGYTFAEFQLGHAYDFAESLPLDYNKAIFWYEKAASKGHMLSQHNLGMMYLIGKVPKDYKKSIDWFVKAANQGHATSHINLGLIYKKGEGVPQDYQKAKQWFKKSADKGDTEARAYLGRLYCSGKGVVKDMKKCQTLVREAYYIGSTAAANTWKFYELWKY